MPLNWAFMLFKSQNIRHDLAWVAKCRQPVNHRHACMFGQLQNIVMRARAHHNGIDIAR